MPNPENRFRGTGRTYRMIQGAIAAARADQYAIIAISLITERERIIKEVIEICLQDKLQFSNTLYDGLHKIMFVGAGSVGFYLIDETFDWEHRRILGMNPATLIFVDHYALELHEADVRAENRRRAEAERAAKVAPKRRCPKCHGKKVTRNLNPCSNCRGRGFMGGKPRPNPQRAGTGIFFQKNKTNGDHPC